jgi:hypothetical protein
MQDATSDKLLDAVYFAATQKRVVEQLEQAKRSVRYARKEFESLKSEKALAPEYQKAYAQMADSIQRTEQAIAETVNESWAQEWEPLAGRAVHHHTPVAPEIVTAVRRTIEEINAAEMRFFTHCKSTMETLRKQDLSGLIDWSTPVQYELSVQLDPGPARAYYDTCGDGEEPLRISLGLYLPLGLEEDEDAYNWNMFEGHPGHPLQADHHGYLVHCIIDHSVIPWQLISHIKEIEVRLEFSTFESVWEKSA